jgi:hypothetical protein
MVPFTTTETPINDDFDLVSKTGHCGYSEIVDNGCDKSGHS